MLEKDCIHGYNCRRINNCPCTSDLEVKRYNDIRKQKRQRDHNIKRKPKMTKRQKKQQEHHNEEQKELEEWKKEHWDPTLEDLK